VLEAFAMVQRDVPDSRLFVGAAPAEFAAIRDHAASLGVVNSVICVEEKESSAVMQDTNVVIATGGMTDDPVEARRPNDVCLQALSMGKALLAADVSRNREATPDGRGCLWFKEGDTRDLAHRMAFLGANPDFRSTLAASGRTYIVETRSCAAVGQQYDVAYRYALKQKRASGPGQNAANLLPITSAT